MAVLRYLVVAIALLLGGWFAFDGRRALIAGDYVTARTGPRAGQLGPWAKVVSVLGIDPRSTGMKVAHVVFGGMWIVGALIYMFAPEKGSVVLLAGSVATLWYVPVGSVLGLVEIGLLIYLRTS